MLIRGLLNNFTLIPQLPNKIYRINNANFIDCSEAARRSLAGKRVSRSGNQPFLSLELDKIS